MFTVDAGVYILPYRSILCASSAIHVLWERFRRHEGRWVMACYRSTPCTLLSLSSIIRSHQESNCFNDFRSPFHSATSSASVCATTVCHYQSFKSSPSWRVLHGRVDLVERLPRVPGLCEKKVLLFSKSKKNLCEKNVENRNWEAEMAEKLLSNSFPRLFAKAMFSLVQSVSQFASSDRSGNRTSNGWNL